MELFPPLSVDANEARYCFFLPAGEPISAQQQCDAFLSFAAQQTCDFLWHKQRFHLQVARHSITSNTLSPYYLSGSTSVGDAIQDEWLVAKLVFDLTRRFPGVVARLADSDGEFLLIESAEALPDWVTPEDSDRRVFIVAGELHIAPPAEQSVRSKDGELFDQDALLQVLDDQVETKAGAAVQRLIQQKLQEVPRYLQENRHRVRCLLPERAARVLQQCKELVGPAVEAFYYREPKQAGFVCGKMKRFIPGGVQGDKVVEKMVTFSRAMFAQLKQQEFYPLKKFLAGDSRFRVLESGSSEENKHPDALAADLGVKLTCGLELLCDGDEEDQLGRPWRELIEELLQQDGSKLPTQPIEPDDDDSWLYMHPDTLESQLQRAAMAGAAAGPGGADELQNMAAMFGKFVDGVSGVEGVEGSEPVHFDMNSFMDLLNGQGGNDTKGGVRLIDEDEFDSDDASNDEDGGVIEEDLALDEAMAEMEAELAGTKVSQSFKRFEEVEEDEKETPSPVDDVAVRETASSSSEKPLDLDYNLLSNLLESVASQEGHAGPVSTILSEMNFPKASV